MNSAILNAREERINNLKRHMRGNYSYIIVKANYPGNNKNGLGVSLIINYFKSLIMKKFQCNDVWFYPSLDGDYYIIEFEIDKIELKKELVEIEESDRLGRFIDLDVYQGSLISVSRLDIGYSKRKCYLCDNDAIICARTKAHKTSDLINKIDTDTDSFLGDTFNRLIKESMLIELELDPKFGLVSKESSGSHKDMDYHLMIKAMDSVIPYITSMGLIGYHNDLSSSYRMIRDVGKECEKRMLEATKGVNCYKGLIFLLGFVVCALGNYLQDFKGSLRERLINLAKPVKGDFESFTGKTFGEEAYLKYNIRGIRGELIDGLNSAFSNIDKIDYSKENLIKALIRIISQIDDTVLLKRSGSIEKYNYYKKLVSSSKLEDAGEVTKECIQNGISFGGAADILVVTIFLKKMKEIFDYE